MTAMTPETARIIWRNRRQHNRRCAKEERRYEAAGLIPKLKLDATANGGQVVVYSSGAGFPEENLFFLRGAERRALIEECRASGWHLEYKKVWFGLFGEKLILKVVPIEERTVKA